MNSREVKADLTLLLECMKYQHNNVNAVTQALITISKTCAISVEAQNILRETGGLKYVHELWICTPHKEVKDAAMFCLAFAIDKNVYSQKCTSTCETFSFIHRVLSESELANKTAHAAMYLLLSLVANNSAGQTLLRNSNCLEKLLQLFQKSSPKCEDVWIDSLDDGFSSGGKELWSAVTSVLCICVNNPQNDENQRICAIIFPQALQLLQTDNEPCITRSVSSFIGLAVANNLQNQLRIEKCNGLEVIVSSLHKAVNRCKQDEQFLKLAVSLAGTIDSIVTENENNAEKCVKLGILPLFLQLLKEKLDESSILQVMLAMGHCTELSVGNQINLVQNGGIGILIHQLSFSQDEELSKSIRYVLQTCVKIDKEALQSQPLQVRQNFDSEVSVLKGLGYLGVDNQASHSWNKVINTEQEDTSLSSKLKQLESELHSAEETNFARCRQFSLEANKNIQLQNNNKKLKNVNNQTKYTLDLTKESDLESLASMVRRRKVKNPRKYENISHNTTVSESTSERELLYKRQTQNMKLSTPFVTPPHNKRKSIFVENDVQKRLDKLEEKFEQHCISQENTQSEIPDTKNTTVNSAPDKTKTYIESKENTKFSTKEEVLCRKLEKELEQERVLRKKLEKEAKDAKAALEKWKQEEKEAARKAQMLADELVKQQMEQEQADLQLEAKVEESIQEHERLIRLKDEKAQELEDIQKSIEKLRNFAEQSGIELTSPQSVATIQTFLTEDRNSLKFTDTSTPKSTNNQVTASKGGVKISCTIQDLSINHAKHYNSDRGNITKSCSVCDDVLECGDSDKENLPNVSKIKDNVVFVKPKTPPTNRRYKQGKMNQKALLCSSTESDSDITVNIPPKYRKLQRISSDGSSILEKGQGDSVLVHYETPSSPSDSVQSDFDHILLKRASHSVPFMIERLLATPISDHSFITATPTKQLKIQTPLSVKKRKSLSYSPNVPSVIKVLDDQKRLKDIKRNLNVTDFSSIDDSCDEPINDIIAVNENNEDQNTKEDSLISKSDNSSDSTKKCPGCQAPASAGIPLLNSHNFNIAIETNPYTCAEHRELRLQERQHIYDLKKSQGIQEKNHRSIEKNNNVIRTNLNLKSNRDIYEFTSSGEEQTSEAETDVIADVKLSPLLSPVYTEETILSPLSSPNRKDRRTRIPYSKQEEFNLIHGVEHMGKFWNQILNTYEFHESRTAADLMEKYKRMNMNHKRCSPSKTSPMKQNSQNAIERKFCEPFSMAEERRLHRGVKLYGNNWSVILHNFKFAKSRSAPELREKWRSLHKVNKINLVTNSVL